MDVTINWEFLDECSLIKGYQINVSDHRVSVNSSAPFEYIIVRDFPTCESFTVIVSAVGEDSETLGSALEDTSETVQYSK
mgnify:CR=1 FL=1